MVVLKFGGTSVGSAQRIRAVAQLITSISGRKVVVLSAMSGTTDTLVALTQLLYQGKWGEAAEVVEALRKRYQTVIEELFEDKDTQAQARIALHPIFEELKTQTHNEAFTVNDEKRIVSKGEIMSVQLMLLAVRCHENIVATHLNALAFMKIDHEGDPAPAYIKEHLRPLLEANQSHEQLFIAEGYICVNAFGEIDNLRRGGSDYSATLIGEAAGAAEIQIWTDIDGLHNSDPRIVNITSPVRRLHFGEAAELAHFGAKILHPACIEPARRANITVRLLYTLDPQARGTTISGETGKAIVKAVSAKDGISILTIHPRPVINTTPSLTDTILAVTQLMSKHSIKADLLSSNGQSYLIAVESGSTLVAFVTDLEEFASVDIQDDMTILAVVGDMGWERVGFETMILEALDDIPLRLISYGSSKYSLVLAVTSEDKKRAMIALSDHLFRHLSLSLEIG